MADPALPRSFSDLTPEWFSGVLGERIRDVLIQPLGQTRGFIGEIVRVRLYREEPSSGGPESLVAKLPTAVGRNRGIGELVSAYEREVRMYRDVLPALPVATPRCFHAAMDPRPGGDEQRRLMAWLQARSDRTLRGLIRLGELAGRFSRRRYVLLLEDLADARFGDQVEDAPLDDFAAALAGLARFHAATWGRSGLDETPTLANLADASAVMRALYRRARPRFEDAYRGRLPAVLTRLLDPLDERLEALLAQNGRAPVSLQHGDYRLDNLAFRPDGVVACDWQSCTIHRGAYDLAYFLSSCLPVGASDDDEADLLRHYHAGLEQHGVASYDLETLVADYRRGIALCASRMVTTLEDVEFEGGRPSLLLDLWIERTARRLDGVALNTVLGT